MKVSTPMDALTKFAWVLENGAIHVKLLFSFMVAILFSPIAWTIQKLHQYKVYLLPEGDFVVIMFIAIMVDLVTGMAKWWKRKQFDFRALAVGLFTKVAISFGGLILFQGLANIDELEGHPDILDYLLLVGKLSVFFYVAGSAFNNLFYLSGGKFPPIGWMKRMKAFEESADTRVFTNDAQEQQAQ